MTVVNKCNLPEDLYYLVDKHVGLAVTVSW